MLGVGISPNLAETESYSMAEKALASLSIHSEDSRPERDDDESDVELIYVENLEPEQLIEYARYGEIKVIEELVHMGLVSKLRSIDAHGNTMLHMAAANGHLDMVRLLLASTHVPTTTTLTPAPTPPTSAPIVPDQRSNEQTTTDQALFINWTNKEGNTALHWASLNGHLATVLCLLEHGADARIQNRAGREAIFEAEQNQHADVVNTLLKLTTFGSTSSEADEMPIEGNVSMES